jgi:hypothetical protein
MPPRGRQRPQRPPEQDEHLTEILKHTAVRGREISQ